MNEARTRFPQVMDRARQILDACPACHDWDHTLRVLNNARHIARAEGVDLTVVEYAAVLHDIGRPDELADAGGTCHAQRGADLVLELLPTLGVADTDFVQAVAACVRTHRYRRRDRQAPASPEAEVVYDADKLDCIGAIGIGRAFHFAGRIGARVHNGATEALASASYSREDSAYREYLVKLRHIHRALLTGEGRRMAAARHDFMVAFFDRICAEVEGEDLALPPSE